MPRHDRWLTRKERERRREEIAAAGGVTAWIRSSKPSPEEERARRRRINALAISCGLSPPYPDEVDCAKAKR